MSVDLTKLCKALAVRSGVSYTYRGRDLQDEEVFSPFGLLPAILKRVESLSLMCLGQGLGVSFKDVENLCWDIQSRSMMMTDIYSTYVSWMSWRSCIRLQTMVR